MEKKRFIGWGSTIHDSQITFHVLLITVLVLLFTLYTLPSSTFAADKLVVKDTGNNTKFVVTDTGQIGAGNAVPESHLDIREEAAAFDRGLTIGQHFSGGAAALINIKRSRGTLNSPTSLVLNDNIAAIHAQGYDGNSYEVPASIMFKVDGAVSDGSVPARMIFVTGTSSSNRPNRMEITSSGGVIVNGLKATYTGGSAYVCVDNNGQLFASESGCP